MVSWNVFQKFRQENTHMGKTRVSSYMQLFVKLLFIQLFKSLFSKAEVH